MQNLNHEAFINKWWLAPSSPLTLEVEEWMNGSYLGDEDFWKEAVFARQEQLLPPSQSHFGKTYNFYHDCILRHVRTNNIAFSVVQEDKYPEPWTYGKIHTCVNYNVDKWANDHLQPGDLIAIVGQPDIHFILALLTALRFGLKVCYLPTNSPFLGKGQLNHFLTEIKPKFIATEDLSFVADGMHLLKINENGFDDENHEPHSFSYQAASELQIALSLGQQEELTLVPLNSQTTYLHSLRDALFTLNLNQHPYFASPLACPIRTEPCSTFMTLLCGATRVYVSDVAIKKNPRLLEDERVNIMGISNDLQQLFSQGLGCPIRYLKYCYKNPLDTHLQTWKPFLQLNKLEKVPNFDLLVDNSCGGAILFSRPSLEPYNVLLKPALGTAWYLSQLNGSGQESLTGFGSFEIEEQPGSGNYMATKIENQLMLTGAINPSRLGVTFPIDQLEESVSALSFVEDCMLHHLPKAGSMFSRYFVLLVFVNPLKEPSTSDNEKWTQEIISKITSTLGCGYLPEKIEYFSLMPKKNILGVDRNWCAGQYSSGLLFQKQEIPQYKILGSLKKLIKEFTIANQEKEAYG